MHEHEKRLCIAGKWILLNHVFNVNHFKSINNLHNMAQELFQVSRAMNEPVKSYCPGSPKRAEIKAMLEKLQSMEV
jgi:hypothetical protein